MDHGPFEISALESADDRRVTANVAGEAALLVAKLHKLHDRVESDRDDRLDDKVMWLARGARVRRRSSGPCRHLTGRRIEVWPTETGPGSNRRPTGQAACLTIGVPRSGKRRSLVWSATLVGTPTLG